MSKTDNTPFSVPSSTEALYYYFGIPSKPLLVARSSTHLWVDPGPEAYLDPKELSPALNKVWESVVAPAMEGYLQNIGVEWTSMDPLRIGKAGESSPPVVIWLGVLPGSLSAMNGLQAAIGCRSFLTVNGIDDVHVEIRESQVTQTVKMYRPVRTTDPTVQVCEPFSTSLGLSICAAATPHIQGTASLFFTDSQRPGELFLLTAAHVVRNPNAAPNELYKYQVSDHRKVMLLGDAAFKDWVEDIHVAIRRKETLIDHFEERLRDIEGMEDEEDAEAERRVVPLALEEAQTVKRALETFLAGVERDWTDPANRVIGHIVLIPPICFNVGAGGFTEDWAVIEVNPSKVDITNFVGNVIDLGTAIPTDEFTEWMYPRVTNPTSFKYPTNRFLKFHSTIPDREMGRPDSRTLDHDNDPTIMVIKRGSTTGLTVGRLNTIRSVVRYYFENMPGERSKEVAVIPRNSKSGAFTEAGDSGSVVVDGKGRVAGIATGGAGSTTVSDCTYVTSINFITERLKHYGSNANIFTTGANL